MYEVEVKVPAELERVRDRLDEIDAERIETVEQVDTYYDAPHRPFADTDEALRIRRERRTADDAVSCDVTYKGPLLEEASKTRIELETAVGDREAMHAILEHLGFDPTAAVVKRRERYEVDGYAVTLDEVTDVGEFVEVEREVEQSGGERAEGEGERGDRPENAGIDEAREGAYAVLEKLELDPWDQIRTSYLELLLEDDS